MVSDHPKCRPNGYLICKLRGITYANTSRLYSIEIMKTLVSCLFLTLSQHVVSAATGYLVHNLVADDKTTATADFYDPRLINPWGNATSAASPFWVCDLGIST